MSESNTPRNSTKIIWNRPKVSAFVLPRVRLRTRSDANRDEQATKQQHQERAFVLESSGRAVLAFSADSIRQATEFCAQQWFTADLRAYRSSIQPIWNGTSELTIRRANAGEAGKLEVALEIDRARRV